MNVSAFIPKSAWLPLTPQGVAAFAAATLNRLLLVQFIFALVGAGTVGWFLSTTWAPEIREAIDALPANSRISRGTLQWTGKEPALIAEGRFLGFGVDMDHTGTVNASSHVLVEFGRNDWRISSVFGLLHLPWLLDTTYPRNYSMALNRTELAPWWGAREPFLIASAMGLTVLFLMLSWAALATLYSVPVWLVAFFGNRGADWKGCWRLAGASLMPGALFMSASILFYGLGAFDLLRLGLAFAMHFVIGWFYLFLSAAVLPRSSEEAPAGGNPFAPHRGEE